MKLKFASLILFALANVSLHAKTDKQPIEVICTNEDDDFVGQQVCSDLRDDIARSPRYRESSEGLRWMIHVVSLSIDGGSSQAVILTAWTGSVEYYIAGWAYTEGPSKAHSQADTILSSADRQIQDILKAGKSGTEQ